MAARQIDSRGAFHGNEREKRARPMAVIWCACEYAEGCASRRLPLQRRWPAVSPTAPVQQAGCCVAEHMLVSSGNLVLGPMMAVLNLCCRSARPFCVCVVSADVDLVRRQRCRATACDGGSWRRGVASPQPTTREGRANAEGWAPSYYMMPAPSASRARLVSLMCCGSRSLFSKK